MSWVDQQREDDSWVPAEPLPEPFGVTWERLWHQRRGDGQGKWRALLWSWLDARAIKRAAEEPR